MVWTGPNTLLFLRHCNYENSKKSCNYKDIQININVFEIAKYSLDKFNMKINIECICRLSGYHNLMKQFLKYKHSLIWDMHDAFQQKNLNQTGIFLSFTIDNRVKRIFFNKYYFLNDIIE